MTAQRATAGLTDFASLRAMPESFDSSSILVRFRPGGREQVCSDILPGTRIGQELGLVSGLHQIHLATGVSVESALAAYRASSLVSYAEPNFSLWASSTTPNDPEFPAQWALENQGQGGGLVGAHINAPPAWDYGAGSGTQIVAVVDTGIDYDHPDLYLNVWINQGEIPASRLQNLFDMDGDGRITFWDLNDAANQGPFQIQDQNGDGRISAADILADMTFDDTGEDLGTGGWANGVSDHGDAEHPDDLVGWNFVGQDRAPSDTNGHGSHVAGIIGAIGDNGIGISGINWRVQLMALKIGEGEELNLAAAIQAIAYAVANGAVVSNHSYTTTEYPQALEDAMAAAGLAGHVVVAAAGNDGQDIDLAPVYPAAFPLANLLAVAATDGNDGLAGFSNYGETTVHLGAPGVGILSTSNDGGYATRSGTSFAAAHVTGAFAWLRDIFTESSHHEIMDLILAGTELIESLAGRTTTGGRLSLFQSLVASGIVPIEEGGTTPGGGGSGGDFGDEDPISNETEDFIAASLTLEPVSESVVLWPEQGEDFTQAEGQTDRDLWESFIPEETPDAGQIDLGVFDTLPDDFWIPDEFPIYAV